MIAEIGSFCLGLALCLSLAQAVLSSIGAGRRSAAFCRAGEGAAYAAAIAVALRRALEGRTRAALAGKGPKTPADRNAWAEGLGLKDPAAEPDRWAPALDPSQIEPSLPLAQGLLRALQGLVQRHAVVGLVGQQAELGDRQAEGAARHGGAAPAGI